MTDHNMNNLVDLIVDSKKTIIAIIALAAPILPGAIIIPTTAVKIAKDMTRGFAKAKKSGTLPK